MRTVLVVLFLSSNVSAALVGIDYDTIGGAFPMNWTIVNSTGLDGGLIDETGTPTSIDAFSTLAGGNFTQSLNPTTIPSHTPSLAGLDGFNNFVTSIVFSDLIPNAAYRLWIFSVYDFDAFATNAPIFDAVVTGSGAPFTFSFDMNQAQGNLVINGVTGSSAQPLEFYGNIVGASSTGTLTINFISTNTVPLGSPELPIAGVAIESFPPVAVPEARAWVMLGVLVLGAFWFRAIQVRRACT
jgi:hypothetical protein